MRRLRAMRRSTTQDQRAVCRRSRSSGTHGWRKADAAISSHRSSYPVCMPLRSAPRKTCSSIRRVASVAALRRCSMSRLVASMSNGAERKRGGSPVFTSAPMPAEAWVLASLGQPMIAKKVAAWARAHRTKTPRSRYQYELANGQEGGQISRRFIPTPGSACWFLLSRGSGLANRPPQKGAGRKPALEELQLSAPVKIANRKF